MKLIGRNFLNTESNESKNTWAKHRLLRECIHEYQLIYFIISFHRVCVCAGGVISCMTEEQRFRFKNTHGFKVSKVFYSTTHSWNFTKKKEVTYNLIHSEKFSFCSTQKYHESWVTFYKNWFLLRERSCLDTCVLIEKSIN